MDLESKLFMHVDGSYTETLLSINKIGRNLVELVKSKNSE